MSRVFLMTLALLAPGSAARAQTSRPATPPAAQSPAQAEAAKQHAADSARGAARGPAATPAAPAAPTQGPASAPQPGVQLPTDTAVPPVATIGWIRVGQTRTGALDNGDYRMGDNTWADVWYFEGAAGQSIVIEVRPRTFDGYLQLLDPAGNKLAEGNHSGSLHDARIAFTLTAAGRYQIVVNNETSDVKTGSYTLSLR